MFSWLSLSFHPFLNDHFKLVLIPLFILPYVSLGMGEWKNESPGMGECEHVVWVYEVPTLRPKEQML